MQPASRLPGARARVYDRRVQLGSRQLAGALGALLLGGCSSHPAAQTAAAAAPAPRRGETAGPDESNPSAPAQPAPAVRVEALTDAHGELAIRVQNHAAEPVELAPALRVERATERGFEATGNELRLHAGSECVRLASGGELRPTWPEVHAAGTASRYRVVLHGCGETYRVDSQPFEANAAR
jgi:hypothetical protein